MPDWREVLKEIAEQTDRATARANATPDLIRRRYLGELATYTGRNVIAYYSGWLSKPGLPGLDINDEDKNGFMMAVHGLDRSKGLDLILHTPGGSIAATHSLVDYLRKMFGADMRAVVPQIAMSAGTMLACSCRTIVLGKHSNLGPIDPHLNGIPTYGIIEEFKRAVREIKRDPSRASAWRPILEQYPPAFLGQCDHAIKWSNEFVKEQLRTVMFAGEPDADRKAGTIVKKLSDYPGNRTHSRHIHADACIAMGLKIEELETDQKLQDLVLTVHHCYTHALGDTLAMKIIENHTGAAIVKQMIVER